MEDEVEDRLGSSWPGIEFYSDKWIYLSQYILGGRGMIQPYFVFFFNI